MTFSADAMATLWRVLGAKAIMRRFVVIHDDDYAERSGYIPTRYQQMLHTGEQLYIARMSRFVDFMAGCLGVR